VVASWEDLRKACAPALADLERTRPGVLRLGPAPDGVPAVDPWGHDVSSLWLWDTDGGSGTGIWLGEPDEDPPWALLPATEVIQSAAIEAVHGAWPECPDHPTAIRWSRAATRSRPGSAPSTIVRSPGWGNFRATAVDRRPEPQPRRHTPAVPTDTARQTGPLVVAVVAGLAHLVVGYFYLAGGLVIPGAVLIPLWLIWLGLAALLVRLAIRRSWWTPAVPVAAAVLFVLVLVVGEQAFDWQA
jgi:hypothetical protein